MGHKQAISILKRYYWSLMRLVLNWIISNIIA
jgi:hypothetical protein